MNNKRFTIFVATVLGIGILLGVAMSASFSPSRAQKENEPVTKEDWPPEILTKIEYIEVVKEVPVLEQTAVDVLPQGEFEVTYYTAGYESTGKRPGDKGYGVTRSGAIVDKNITVAVDPTVIPLGTYLYIEGIGLRVAQDTGSAIKGNKIDIYTPNLQDAKKGGRHKAKVYILDVSDNE